MGRLAVLAGVACAAVAVPAFADDRIFLERFESQVFEGAGDRGALTRRGATCIAQKVKPGLLTAPTIISQDNDAGVIVANFGFEYVDKFLISTVEQARSKLVFEAKDGRFRMTFTDNEQYDRHGRQWRPAVSWKEKHLEPLKAQMTKVANEVADCVRQGATDW